MRWRGESSKGEVGGRVEGKSEGKRGVCQQKGAGMYYTITP